MKGTKLRTAFWIFAAAAFGGLLVNAGTAEEKAAGSSEKVYLTADFEPGEVLRYEFTSKRDIELNWDPSGRMSRGGGKTNNRASESLEIVVAYEPVEVNPYGLSKIKATCESVRQQRTSSSARGGGSTAVQSFRGKSWTFTVRPDGVITENAELYELVREIGQKAFRPQRAGSKGKVKEQDMIGDFWASQWFLFDCISSIERPADGVAPGQMWTSILSVPTPMVSREGRSITYKLVRISPSPKGRLAVIESEQTLAERVPLGWPIPYVGSFQMAGMFGFLRGYKYENLEGNGTNAYNVDKGRLEHYTHKYTLKAEARMLMPLGPNPLVKIDQTLTAKLLEE